MPLYDYECRDCGHTEEKLASLETRDSPERTVCGKCGGPQIRQCVYAVGARYKGDGWTTKFKKADPNTGRF